LGRSPQSYRPNTASKLTVIKISAAGLPPTIKEFDQVFRQSIRSIPIFTIVSEKLVNRHVLNPIQE